MRSIRKNPMRPPNGSATIVVLWSIAIAAIIVAATQMVSWRTATLGRSSIGRVQARWAARAGVERVHRDGDSALLQSFR